MTKKEYEEAVQVIANFKAEIKLKDTQIEELEHTVSGLNEMWLEEKDKCVTCECAKFADKMIKPSKMLETYRALEK